MSTLMLCDVRALAPAKINIGLRVLPTRADGYHGIESIFQTIPLYDKLTLRVLDDGKGKCKLLCKEMYLPKTNTLSTAYEAFCAVTGVTESVQIELEKKIPSGAGLGGGSSDAATLIHVLDAVFDTKLSQPQKQGIAGRVGSDVYFFVECANKDKPFAALVRGRGEIVEPIIPRQDLFFVLICPEVHSSTKKAYSLVDQWNASGWEWKAGSIDELESMYKEPVETWRFVNSFTEPLVDLYPLIGECLQDLQRAGASYTQMSGSGSAVFGVFSSESIANTAFLKLRKKWRRCFTFASS